MRRLSTHCRNKIYDLLTFALPKRSIKKYRWSSSTSLLLADCFEFKSNSSTSLLSPRPALSYRFKVVFMGIPEFKLVCVDFSQKLLILLCKSSEPVRAVMWVKLSLCEKGGEFWQKLLKTWVELIEVWITFWKLYYCANYFKSKLGNHVLHTTLNTNS